MKLVGKEASSLFTSCLPQCKAPIRWKVPTNSFEVTPEVLFFLIRAPSLLPELLRLAAYPSSPCILTLVVASVPASYTAPTCQSGSFTWTFSVGVPACSLPKPPGELCLSSLLEMPQCIHQLPWRAAFPPERPHKLLSQDSGGRS